jgi:hypothetical protein
MRQILCAQRELFGDRRLNLRRELAHVSVKQSLIANAVHVSSALAQTVHGTGLPGEAIQGASLGRGELAGGRGALGLQLEQCRAQGLIRHQASKGSMICQLKRLIWLLPWR